jgi:hypothetical protein
MTALTSHYLSAALRLRGPGCERAFLAREARSLLRGAHPEDAMAHREGASRPEEPPPVFAGVAGLRLVRRAA